jgi:autotransporter-associated beta strand protein
MTITNNSASTLTLGGNVSMTQGGLLTLATTSTASTIQLNGNITDSPSNPGSLALSASGTNSGNNTNFILNGTDTYSGTTSITVNTGSLGSIQLGTDSPFGTSKVFVNLVTGATSAQLQALNSTRTISNAMDLNGGLNFIGFNSFNLNGPLNIINATAGSRTLNALATGIVVSLGSTGSASTITLGNPLANGGDNAGKTLALTVSSGSMIVVNDAIQDPATGGGTSSGNVTPTGVGTVLFNDQSTYTGLTTLSGGGTSIQIASSSIMSGSNIISGPFGASTVVANNSTNSLIEAVGGDRTVANPVVWVTGMTVQNAPTTGINANTSGNLTFTGPFSLLSTTSRTFVFDTPGKTVTMGASPNSSTITFNPATAVTGPVNLAIAVATNSTLIINDVMQDNLSGPTSPDTVSYVSFGTAPANGFGTLVLNAASTYTGMTTFTGGSTNTTAATIQFGTSSVTSGTNIVSGPVGRGTFEPSNQAAPPMFEALGADQTIANPMIISPSGFFVANAPGTPFNLSFTGPISLQTGRTLTNNMGTSTTFTMGATGTNAAVFSMSGQLVLQTQISGGGNTVINDQLTDGSTSKGNIIFQNNVQTTLTNPNNTFTGGVAVNSGAKLTVSADGNLGAATGTVSINAGTLLSTGTFSSIRNVALNGTGTNTIDATGTNVLTLTGGLTGTGSLTKGTNSGTLQLANIAGYTLSGSVTAGGGLLAFGAASSFTNTPNGPVVSGGGLSGPVNITGALTINANASAALNPSLPGTGKNNSVGSLSVGNGGSLDIGNHTVIVQNAPDETVIGGYLSNGYAGGFWNGTSPSGGAIKSIVAFNDNSGSTSIGYGNSADFTFGGSTSPYAVGGPKALSGNQVVVAPALAGDLLLSGTVGPNELALMLGSFGTTGNDWAFGNIDYDAAGLVGPNDLSLLLSNFGHSSAGFTGAKTSAKSLTSTAKPSLVASASDVAPPPADGIELIVNSATGDVQIEGNNATLVTSIVLTSAANGLVGGTTFTPAFSALFNTSASNTNGLIDEFNTFTNGSAVNGLVDMGDVYNTTQNSNDIQFQFSEKGINRGSLQTGSVTYVGVPEPTTLSLLVVASAGLLGRRRRNKSKADAVTQD